MISATLSASDLDDLRTELPSALENFERIAVGTIVDLEFKPMRLLRASDGLPLAYLLGTVAEGSEGAVARFDAAHLIERLTFAQNLHPRPREATVNIELRDGDPRWWFAPVVDGEVMDPIVAYPANLSAERVTLTDWLGPTDTVGWISDHANRAVFDFALDVIDVLANLPAEEKVTLVFAESAEMYSTNTVVFRRESGDEIAVPVRFSGIPTQMTFGAGYLLDKYRALCQKFDSGVAQLGLFWNRDNHRDWFAAARWGDAREFEWVNADYGSVIDPPAPLVDGAAFCPACGAPFGDGAKFCARCGAAR